MASFKDILDSKRGYEEFKKKEEEQEEKQKNYVARFWLPPEASTKIVFLDDDPPIIEEHQLKIDGDWRNWFTCLRIIGEACPICDVLESPPYTVGFYTVIDMAEFTDRRGNERKNERKLFTPKFKALQMMKRFSAKRGSLKGCVFEVYRSSKDSFNTGDVFDFEGKLDEDEIKKLNVDVSPFDYAEILKPKTVAELKRILKRNSEKSGKEFEDLETDADDVQF